MGQCICNFLNSKLYLLFSRVNRHLKNMQWNLLPIVTVSSLAGCIQQISNQGIWLRWKCSLAWMRLHGYRVSRFHKNPISRELICSWKLPGLLLSKSWVSFCLLFFFLWQRWQKKKISTLKLQWPSHKKLLITEFKLLMTFIIVFLILYHFAITLL